MVFEKQRAFAKVLSFLSRKNFIYTHTHTSRVCFFPEKKEEKFKTKGFCRGIKRFCCGGNLDRNKQKMIEDIIGEEQPLINNAKDNGSSSSSSSSLLPTLKKTVGFVALAGATVLATAGTMSKMDNSEQQKRSFPWLGSVDGYPTETYSDPSNFDQSIAGKKKGKNFQSFFTFGKSGGTSIEIYGWRVSKLGSCNSEGIGFDEDRLEIAPAWVVENRKTFTRRRRRDMKNSFVTVRNPYARAESEFAWFKARYFHRSPLGRGL